MGFIKVNRIRVLLFYIVKGRRCIICLFRVFGVFIIYVVFWGVVYFRWWKVVDLVVCWNGFVASLGFVCFIFVGFFRRFLMWVRI